MSEVLERYDTYLGDIRVMHNWDAPEKGKYWVRLDGGDCYGFDGTIDGSVVRAGGEIILRIDRRVDELSSEALRLYQNSLKNSSGIPKFEKERGEILRLNRLCSEFDYLIDRLGEDFERAIEDGNWNWIPYTQGTKFEVPMG